MRIHDIATIASCTLPKQDTVWLLNLDVVEQQTGKVTEYKYINPDSLTGSTTAFDTNTVLYSRLRPNLNKVVVPTMSGYATSEMLPLRPDPQKCTREYLAFYLRSNAFVEWAVSKTNGAKMPRLGTKELLDKEIPLPSIPAQKHIVAVFTCVEGLIDDLSEMLSYFDELVKSRFVEMFGDPESNPMGWPVKKLNAVVSSITAGWSANGEARPKKAGEKAVLKVSAVTQGYFKPDEHKVIPADMEIKKYVYPQKGDLLFSRANTRELVGATAIIDQDYPELLYYPAISHGWRTKTISSKAPCGVFTKSKPPKPSKKHTVTKCWN